MDMSLLAIELAKTEYQSMTDQEATDAINSKTAVRSKLVETWRIKQHAIENGYWPGIVIATESSNPSIQVRGLAISAKDWIDNMLTIDMENAAVQALLGGLVLSGLMTQQQAVQLLALGTETVAWSTANGMPSEIGIGHVINARRGN